MTTAVTAIGSRRKLGGTSAQLIGHARPVRQRRWVAVAAATILSCTCQRGSPPPAAPPPSPPPPQSAPGVSEPDVLGSLRDQAASFSIALLPVHQPKQNVKALVAEVASAQFPSLKAQSPGEPLGSLPVVIAGAYRSPGLSPEVLDAQSGADLL